MASESMPKPLAPPLVLVVDNARGVTGGLNAIRHATNPLREQQALRFQYVLPTGSSGRPLLEADGYVVHELPFLEISRRKADLLGYLPRLLLNGWRLYRLASREGASIIHQNDFYNLAGYVAKLCSLGRLRIIVHVRLLPQAMPAPLARFWSRLAVWFADYTVCVSQAVRRYFSSRPNLLVIYDPLPETEHYATPLRPLNPTQASVQLLYLSNYMQGKGQDLALQAFRLAYAQNKRLRLRFVGSDMGMGRNKEFRQQLEAEVAQYHLGEAVQFEGFVADVEAAMKAADIVLNFSEAESFSLTCLDALFYGTPLIASDCGGPAELFENGCSGLLVPNRDVPAMAAAIGQLSADVALRTGFAEAGRHYVRKKFAPANTFQALGQLYWQVLASKR